MSAEYLPFFAISLHATTRNMLAEESTSIVYSPSVSAPEGVSPPVFTAVSDLKVSWRSYHWSFFRECAATETGVSSCTSGSS